MKNLHKDMFVKQLPKHSGDIDSTVLVGAG